MRIGLCRVKVCVRVVKTPNLTEGSLMVGNSVTVGKICRSRDNFIIYSSDLYGQDYHMDRSSGGPFAGTTRRIAKAVHAVHIIISFNFLKAIIKSDNAPRRTSPVLPSKTPPRDVS